MHFRIAHRHLWKHKFYTLLNVFGLSLGIAGGLILYLFISYHLSFDRYHTHAKQLYRLVTTLNFPDGSEIHDPGSSLPMLAGVQQALPDIQDAAASLKIRDCTIANAKGELFAEHDNAGFADAHWFKLFNYQWEEGDPTKALDAPNTIVLTRSMARKYFGQQEAIGQVLRIDNKQVVTVTGVLKDIPDNTDLTTQLFVSRASMKVLDPITEQRITTEWNYISSTTSSFVLLKDGSEVKKVEQTLTRLRDQHFSPDVASAYHFTLQPLSDIHFDNRYGGIIQRSLLFSLGFTGFLLVVIACFNFINLASAQSAKRAREIGTRKVLGSTATEIFNQFMAETVYIALLATVLAFVWILLFLPVLNTWLQIKLSLMQHTAYSVWLCAGLLLVFVVFCAGFYPAIILSRFKPIDTLKQQVTGNSFYRKGLVLLQNVVVQALIIATLVISLQVKHLKSANLGFDKTAMLMVNIPVVDKNKMDFLKNQLLTQPGVKAVSFCFRPPSSTTKVGGSVSYDDRNWEDYSVSTALGDASYQPTFQLQLVAGRNIQPSDTIREFLINETLVHRLGLKPDQVIGHRLVAGDMNNHPGTIVGVLKDFNAHTLYDRIEPLLVTSEWDRYQLAAIKLQATDQDHARDLIRTAWQSVYPNNVFEYHYLDSQIDAFYHKEDLLNRLIYATAGIAILISCLGLLGLISFFAIQRTREIGIRKVLGASTSGIVYLLSKDFLKIVLLSVVVSVPLAGYFMSQWLHDFPYRINIGWWVYALAALTSVCIAMLTVSIQAIKAAMANPAKSLKTE
jgi:putative ABC transport system permease protein